MRLLVEIPANSYAHKSHAQLMKRLRRELGEIMGETEEEEVS